MMPLKALSEIVRIDEYLKTIPADYSMAEIYRNFRKELAKLLSQTDPFMITSGDMAWSRSTKTDAIHLAQYTAGRTRKKATVSLVETGYVVYEIDEKGDSFEIRNNADIEPL